MSRKINLPLPIHSWRLLVFAVIRGHMTRDTPRAILKSTPLLGEGMILDPTRTSLELLLNISRELSASLDLPRVLERVLSLSTESVGAERGSLIVLNPVGEPLAAAIVVKGQLHRPSTGEMADILDHGLAGWVVDQRQPVLISDTSKDSRWVHRPDDELSASGPKSAVCVPLLAVDQLTGVLTLVHAQPRFFNEQHLQLAQAIAGLAGMAVRNANLFTLEQEAQRRYRELFEDSIDPILLSGWDGRVLNANRQAARSLGRELDALLGLSVLDLHAAPAERLGENFSALRNGGTITYESQLHALDGTSTPVEVHIRRVQLGNEENLQWIMRDIRERKQLDTLRDDLMAMIYHDLRSPLANIISSLDILSTIVSSESDPSVEMVMQIATRSTDRLQRLISSLLDIYRLESGQAIVRKADIDPAELVRDGMDVIRPLADGKNQLLTMTIADELPLISVDYDMIRRVFINLLENAVKFTPNGGTIEAGCVPEGLTVTFWVQDTGPGIPPESRDRIFEKYSRLQTDRFPKGIGLGLAFCRLAVLAHGGKIWVESTAGSGSRFIFTLPASV